MLYKRHPFSVLITTVASWHQPQQVMIIILTQCVKSTLFRIKKNKSFFYLLCSCRSRWETDQVWISAPTLLYFWCCSLQMGIMWFIPDRKCLLCAQEHNTMENTEESLGCFLFLIFLIIEGYEWGSRGQQRGSEQVLVLVFSFCVIPSSKRVHHKCGMSWNKRNPCHLSSPVCSVSSPVFIIPFPRTYTDERNVILKAGDIVWTHADRHVERERVRGECVCVWLTYELGRKVMSNKQRAEQLFALIRLVRHTQAPQEEHSSLKLTFALYWQGAGWIRFSVALASKMCLLFPIFSNCVPLERVPNTHVSVFGLMSTKGLKTPDQRIHCWFLLASWSTSL